MLGNLFNLEGDLWGEFQRLQREMDDLFNWTWGQGNIRAVAPGTYPAINIGETPDAVNVYVFAPGIDPSKLDLSIQRNLLTISGERRTSEPEGKAQSYLRERFNGSFRRVISLPDDIDPNQVNATYRNGVLGVIIARHEAAKPRQIQVTA